MLIAKALVHGDFSRLLTFNKEESPVAVQLGGSDPKEMTSAARYAEDAGFSEININVGCPSNKVQSGEIGACLMRVPETVAACVRSISMEVNLPVTVKTRIGIDELDDYEHLANFIDTVSSAGCSTFIIHARKAWLKGLSPKQNRDVPPLDYQRVYRMKEENPHLQVIINGGITTVDQVLQHRNHVDGVMIGREITRNPWLLSELEDALDENSSGPASRKEVQREYAGYMQKELARGTSVHALVRPLSGLYHGMPGARQWRRMLSTMAQDKAAKVHDLPRSLSGFS
jgi:tRNA-dihydrouridine synthase A